MAATIKNSGFYFPTTRIKANLAPADVRKEASAFDLPIALGVFAATAQIRDKSFDQTLVCQVLKLGLHENPRITGGLERVAAGFLT